MISLLIAVGQVLESLIFLHLSSLVKLSGVDKAPAAVTSLVLAGANPNDENSFENPRKIAPVETKLPPSRTTFGHAFPPYSTTVLRIPME